MLSVDNLRILSLVITASTCFLVGRAMAQSFVSRVEALKGLKRGLEQLQINLIGLHKPLRDALHSCNYDTTALLNTLAEHLEKVNEEAWIPQYDRLLDEKEVLLIKQLVRDLTCSEPMLNESRLVAVLKEIDLIINEATEISNKNGKLSNSLGGLFGLAILIILF